MKYNVMIVDDNVHFLKAFRFILQNDHAEKIKDIYVAKDGQECMELLEKNPVDIVFMDLEMPNMNGVEATKMAVDQYWGIKVVAVSFHSDLNDIKKMLEAGARNYIIKEEINKEIIERCLTK
jgi:two-component system response regulator DegU